jgi:hypothetical protein
VITKTSGAAPQITNAPPMAPGIGGHNIDLPPPRSRPFEGDVAIKDLKRRLSLDRCRSRSRRWRDSISLAP